MRTTRIAMLLQPVAWAGIAYLLSSTAWCAELPPNTDGAKAATSAVSLTMSPSIASRSADAAAIRSAIERPIAGIMPPVTPAIHSPYLPPNACKSSASTVCYDYEGGRAVFIPGKNFMPQIPGLTAEHLSVRRDKVVLSYSF